MRSFVFDTETSGLVKNILTPLSQQPEVIELYGAVVNDDGEIIDEFDELIRPEHQISAEITTITTITNDMLKQKERFKFHAPRIKDIIEGCDEVVVHNLSFDMNMINFEFQRIGEEISWPQIKICTVEQTEYLKGRRLKLIELHTLLFDEGFPNAHRAKPDVDALIRCFKELRSRGIV